MSKKALILGIGGQDGSYLAEILLEKGYEVSGMYRRSSTGNLKRIEHIKDKVTSYQGDLLDQASLARILIDSKPDEIYNECDQDNVGYSYSAPGYSADVTAGAVGKLLEHVRLLLPEVRVFQPVSATMFGNSDTDIQNELTPLNPQSPYAVCKAAAYHWARYYRQSCGMFV